MADELTRAFTERELELLVAAKVSTEMADMSAKLEAALADVKGLTDSNAELASKLELSQAETAAAVARVETAEAAFEAHKAEEAAKAEKAALVVSRTESAKAILVSLPETFFTPERAQVWAGLTQEAFDLRIAELAEVTGGTVGVRESASAMQGQPVTPTNQDMTGRSLFVPTTK